MSTSQALHGSAAQSKLEQSGATETAIFWAFVAALAWVPFLYGSNGLLAWGINALLFPSIAIIYEVSLFAAGKSHPVALKEIWVSATLFALVVAWIFVQNATWTPTSWHHPIWAMAARVLDKPIPGSISVDRDLTTQALMRLLTSASVFWIAVQLCRDAPRAQKFIISIGAIAFGYATYGILAWSLAGDTPVRGFVSSTFYNWDHYATYAGIGFIVIFGVILDYYNREITRVGGLLRHRIGAAIEMSARTGAVLNSGGFVVSVALLMTGARGGILATVFGIAALLILWFGHLWSRSVDQPKARAYSTTVALLTIMAVGVSISMMFGDAFFGKITGQGLRDVNRLAVYAITLRSITDAPLLGYGYGTFADVFPMFRDQSIVTAGVWEQAHNTYLEIFQDSAWYLGQCLSRAYYCSL